MVQMTGNSLNAASACYVHCYITYSKFSFSGKYQKCQKYHDIFDFNIFENISRYFPTLLTISASEATALRRYTNLIIIIIDY